MQRNIELINIENDMDIQAIQMEQDAQNRQFEKSRNNINMVSGHVEIDNMESIENQNNQSNKVLNR